MPKNRPDPIIPNQPGLKYSLVVATTYYMVAGSVACELYIYWSDCWTGGHSILNFLNEWQNNAHVQGWRVQSPIRRNPIRQNPNPNPNFGESGFGESGRHRVKTALCMKISGCQWSA